MKMIMILVLSVFVSVPALAKKAGFYTKGVSASTAKGARMLVTELIENQDNHQVCYEGDYQSALDNTHDSISISVIDVYGESEFPTLDTEVQGQDGRSAYGNIPACSN